MVAVAKRRAYGTVLAMRVELASQLGFDALLAVANTRHGPEAVRPVAPPPSLRTATGYERLRSARATRDLLVASAKGIPPGLPAGGDLLRLRDIREAARALAEGDTRGYERRLAKLLSHGAYRVNGRAEVRSEGGAWAGFVGDLAIVLVALRPLARRLRICHNPRCGWTFIDRTRNESQVWCETQRCGDRMRVRRARSRRTYA